MKIISTKLRKLFFNKKFLGFCIIGIVNTFNTAFFSWLAHLITQKNIAAIFGYIVSLSINYVLNSLVVFKKSISLRKFIRFIISYIPNFIIYFLVTFITINTLHMYQFWGTVLAAMAGAPITFAIIKIYAFGYSSDE